MNIHQHYNLVRSILGLYLFWHFSQFSSTHFDELFGTKMPFPPAITMLPNLFLKQEIIMPLCLLFIFSKCTPYKILSSLTAITLWYTWITSIHYNPFISNPGMPYVGWLLLVYIVEPYLTTNDKITIYYIAWFLMALGYTVSGLHKLQCPSWQNGTALLHVLQSPLARDNYLVTILLQSPFLKPMTWGSLFLEISFLPLGLFYYTCPIYSLLYIGFHLGILATINFVDLTLGVLMIHIFTLDYKKLKFY